MPHFDKKKSQWVGAVMVRGQREQKIFGQKDQRKAAAWEVNRRKEILEEQNNPKPQPKPEDMELRMFFSLYLDFSQLHFAPKTYVEKRALLQEVSLKWGGSLPVKSVTPALVTQFLNDKAKAGVCSSNAARKNLLAIWHWGMKVHDLGSNPISKTVPLPHEEAEGYTPSEQDVLKVLAVANQHEKVFLLAYLQTAARKSEIFRWEWSKDLDFGERKIRLGTRKTRDGSMEYEWLPMTPDLEASLRWLWENQLIPGNPYVFPITQPGEFFGQPFRDRRKLLGVLCKKAGVRVFKYHAMRRFCASILVGKYGASAKIAQLFLRHKALVTTERYIGKPHSSLRDTMALLHTDVGTPFTSQFTSEPLSNQTPPKLLT